MPHEAQAPPREPPAAGFSPHSVRLAWILALAYSLVVVYASLQPLRGWRWPPPEVAAFLGAPWPRYVTLEDIAVNVAAYAPLGFLLSIGWGGRLGAAAGALAAAASAAALSLALEAVQTFLPARIASNVDFLANAAGALLGALAAPLFAPTRLFGAPLHGARRRLFVEGMAADVGLVLAGLWPLTQFHPTAQLFGTGSLRASLELPAYFAYTPALAFGGEAAVAGFNVLAVGLMLGALARAPAGPLGAAGALVGAAAAVKAGSALLVPRPGTLLAWLTPGALAGLLLGFALLAGAVRLPRAAQCALAALALVAAIAATNLAPDNPYQSLPPQLVAGGASHILSFSAIARALSELWPLAALVYLVSLLARGARV